MTELKRHICVGGYSRVLRTLGENSVNLAPFLEAANGLQPKVQDGRLKLYLYDPIDEYAGVGPTAFVEAIAGKEELPIDLYINSPGGDCWDGRAIKNILSRHDAGVTAYVDGLCASAATTVSLGAQKINAYEGSRYMVHRCWTFAIGDAATLRKEAELCGEIDRDIARDYVERTGMTLDAVLDYMDKETFFSAEDAVAKGFANSVVPAPKKHDNSALENMRNFAQAMAQFAQHLATGRSN